VIKVIWLAPSPLGGAGKPQGQRIPKDWPTRLAQRVLPRLPTCGNAKIKAESNAQFKQDTQGEKLGQ